MEIFIWDGITRAKTLYKESAAMRHELADAAKSYNWHRVCELTAEHEDLVNSTRPEGSSLFAPLHQAAYGGAAIEVVQRLIDMGAWRTLRNVRGERPVDVAIRKQHTHLLTVLKPVYKRWVPLDVLLKIQHHFHGVIRSRAEQLVQNHALRLPQLEILLEPDRSQMWFPVPGMRENGNRPRFSAGKTGTDHVFQRTEMQTEWKTWSVPVFRASDL